MRGRGEDGYALVAAVASITVFAAMAFTVLAATGWLVQDAGAEQDELQAGAAADAGIALALSHLLSRDVIGRWSIDGRGHDVRFGEARLQIRVEDERGKVPINLLNDAQATRLLEQAGLTGDALRTARDSLLDWVDDDDRPRPFGAEAAYYAEAGLRPANGFMATVGELGRVRGFDRGLVDRIAPFVTVTFNPAGFDPRFADPRAIAVMEEGGANGTAAIERAKEIAGQRTAIAWTDSAAMTGRPLAIIVTATLPDGARARRQVIVELTGAMARPYVIRSYGP